MIAWILSTRFKKSVTKIPQFGPLRLKYEDKKIDPQITILRKNKLSTQNDKKKKNTINSLQTLSLYVQHGHTEWTFFLNCIIGNSPFEWLF